MNDSLRRSRAKCWLTFFPGEASESIKNSFGQTTDHTRTTSRQELFHLTIK